MFALGIECTIKDRIVSLTFVSIDIRAKSRQRIIVRFTLTLVKDFCRFLSRFGTNCHEIFQTLFSIYVATTLNITPEVIMLDGIMLGAR